MTLQTYQWGFTVCVVMISMLILSGCQSSNQPAASSPLPSATQDWITYIKEPYHYSFDYPKNMLVEVMKNDPKTVRVHAGSGEPFHISTLTEYSPGDAAYFLDTEAAGQRRIGEFTWQVYLLPDGYCDGPNCSPPIYGLQMEANQVLYRITIYSQDNPTPLQEAILATLRIIP